MHVIIATHNKHKIGEIGDVIKGPQINVSSLLDHEVKLPPETGTTFVGNARIKALAVYNALREVRSAERSTPYDTWVLADDSGLAVDVLNGQPGVYSSRYSGEPVDYDRNNRKLLQELKCVPFEKRTACFICSMILIDPAGKEYEIEGRVNGFIVEKGSEGTEGFGYDPVFYLSEYKRTIAEMPLSEKNKISHRGLAAKKALEILVEFLDKRR
ncbi:MAG: non-canonical purine NTP pyrophosphatase, RdgB/HAM1 family [Deltaproteobacteria bacterium CG11_big_fil_rev_8_21_14_0_20_49_13]|nr:MAG: non-canonical purine NTP pyrophosphatase, RdgB/HAM1 family [Deltaproteobacteria bacterium CG11_big_fil_rev_8_21_14_0_20_49_13]